MFFRFDSDKGIVAARWGTTRETSIIRVGADCMAYLKGSTLAGFIFLVPASLTKARVLCERQM